MDLSATEIRVLGCLLEKQRTTPDHYPLSLNSLRLACNQSTNRDPVVDYDDAIIRDALHRLERRGYARLAGASRAAKYRHLLSETLPMSSSEQAVMCVLMLRGGQTPGELKQRGERIHAFEGLDEVHATLTGLIARDLVAQLERRAGQKEERYIQLLGDGSSASGNAVSDGGSSPQAVSTRVASPPVAQQSDGLHDRLARLDDGLHDRVARLEREVAELRTVLAEFGEVGSERVGQEPPGESSPETAAGVDGRHEPPTRSIP
ncbi:MAG TPA: YceH family protein [Solirubrobacteraceae bacterium]|jgi:uncharacterized protein YceH (UPF0502 family)|nr:YceH family protein [Solirubrobacteraceae bacterium]